MQASTETLPLHLLFQNQLLVNCAYQSPPIFRSPHTDRAQVESQGSTAEARSCYKESRSTARSSLTTGMKE